MIPPDDPGEPWYESETIQWLKDVEAHAQQGDIAWLKRIGKVYEAVDAA